MPGSWDHNWGAACAAYSAPVPAILQQHPNAPITGQALPADEIPPSGMQHSSAAGPRRIAPSLRPDLISDRHSRGKIRLTNGDCLFFVQLYRWFPSIRSVVHILRPETLVRWHRDGFRSYWRWKSRNRGGRPQIDADLRALIGQMNLENPLWGAPRIHGELLKLGFEVAQSTIAKYMVEPQGRPPGQSWWTFLRNHIPEIAAMDLFVVPTLAFELLYGSSSFGSTVDSSFPSA